MKNKTLGNTLIIVGTMIGAGIRYKMAQNAFFCTKKKQGDLPCFIDLVEIIGIEPTTS